MVAPILERVAKKYAGALKVVKVNVDGNRALQMKFKANSIPTMLLLKNGKVVARQVGAMNQSQLEAWLASKSVNPSEGAQGMALPKITRSKRHGRRNQEPQSRRKHNAGHANNGMPRISGRELRGDPR